MRAARLDAFDPELEGPEFLSLDEVPEPEIEEPDDVIVKVGGAGVCRTDLHLIQGLWQDAQETDLPYTLGHENAGWVAETGAAASGFTADDPVLVLPGLGDGTCGACRRGLENRCENLVWQGIQIDGGFTRYLRTKARNLLILPDGIDPRDAAPYVDAGITAYHASKRAARRLAPDEPVVVIGIGGLGHVAVQVLRTLTPARIIAVDIAEDALRFARELGADETVLATGTVVDDVLDLTSGRGARAVIDFVSEGEVPNQAFAMTGVGGTYYVVGYGGTLTLPTLDIMGTERRIVGNVGGPFHELAELMALAERGEIELHTRRYPFDEVNRALADLRDGEVRGRGVLVMD